MAGAVQLFLAGLVRKAAADLITAVEGLPEEKIAWSPLDKGRSAVDQAAECAILNGFTSQMLSSGVFPADFTMEKFMADKAALAADWAATKALLTSSAEHVATTIEAVPDEQLEIVIDMPWGPHTIAQIMAYPLWNMSYHEGQTNYISSLLA